MISITITWQYAYAHRYNSDLDDKVDERLEQLVEETGSKDEGSAGGCGVSDDPDGFIADSARYLTVADREVAERIRAAVEEVISEFDARYRARLLLTE